MGLINRPHGHNIGDIMKNIFKDQKIKYDPERKEYYYNGADGSIVLFEDKEEAQEDLTIQAAAREDEIRREREWAKEQKFVKEA